MTIALRILGSVDLRDTHGRALPTVLAQPKRLAILAFLASGDANRVVRRDTLLGVFWPDRDAAHARNALDQAVHHLRRALGEGVLLNRGEGELVVDAAMLTCDAAEFERAIADGRHAAAVDLYRGPLLDGFFLSDTPAFEQWLETERARLNRLAAAAAWALVDEAERAGSRHVAVDRAHQALALEPLDEGAVRRFLELLNRVGDAGAAVRAYDDFARRLDAELELQPSAETRRIIDDIRRRAPRAVAPAIHRVADAPVALPALSSPPTRRWRSRRTIVVAALVAMSAVAGAALLSRPSSEPPVPMALIAVMPFFPSDGDSALARRGRDLAVTLSASLEGLEGMRTADAVSVLSIARPGGPLSIDSTRALARRLRASSVLQGTVVHVGAAIRADATLYSVETGVRLASASVTAPADSISALTDALVLSLLPQMWKGRVPAPPGLAAFTRSLPALRAYLEGEQLLAEGRFRAAPLAFRRAMDADSTFWFAYWRYYYAMSYRNQRVDSAVVAAVRLHRFELPERDRLLVEARMTDSASVRLARARLATERHPEYGLAWFDYADQLVHSAPYLGTTRADAVIALERAVMLNPDFTDGWEHLFWMGASGRDTVVTRRALRELERLRLDSASRFEANNDQLLLYRFLDSRLGTLRPTAIALTDSVAEAVREYHGPIPPSAFEVGAMEYGLPSSQAAFARRLLEFGPPTAIAAALHRGLAQAWAARGAWDSALVVADRHVAAHRGGDELLFRYRLAVVGAHLGAIGLEVGQRARSALATAVQDLTAPQASELAWLDGLRATDSRDASALARARKALYASGDSRSLSMLDASLIAYSLLIAGEDSAAGRALLRLELDRAEQGRTRVLEQHPFLTGVNRLTASRLLLAAGDTTNAIRLLSWHEAILFGAPRSTAAGAILGPIADLTRARVARARGLSTAANESYRRFLDQYDAPSAQSLHLTEEARRALASSGCPGSRQTC